jgi:hypothetical protein
MIGNPPLVDQIWPGFENLKIYRYRAAPNWMGESHDQEEKCPKNWVNEGNRDFTPIDLSKFQLGFSDHLSGSHQFLPFQTLTQSSNPRPHPAHWRSWEMTSPPGQGSINISSKGKSARFSKSFP